MQMFERFAALNGRKLWKWSITSGLRRVGGTESAFNTTRIEDALRHIEKSLENAIYLFLDAHRFLGEPLVLRQIRDIAASERTQRMLAFCSPRLEVPEEIERITARFRPALPGPAEITALLNEEARSYREATGERVRANREALGVLTQHLGGVTEEDVRRLARLAIRDDGAISAADVAEAMGWPGFFLVTVAAGIPGLLLLKRRLREGGQLGIVAGIPDRFHQPLGVHNGGHERS